MSKWSITGPWGVVVASTDEAGRFVWEAQETDNKVLMQDLLTVAREEYPPTGEWRGLGYVPDLLENAVQQVTAEFGGTYKLLEANVTPRFRVIF